MEENEEGGTPGQKSNNKDSEAQKVRKQFDDQLDTAKKNSENQIKTIKISMSDEIEKLTGMLS